MISTTTCGEAITFKFNSKRIQGACMPISRSAHKRTIQPTSVGGRKTGVKPNSVRLTAPHANDRRHIRWRIRDCGDFAICMHHGANRHDSIGPQSPSLRADIGSNNNWCGLKHQCVSGAVDQPEVAGVHADNQRTHQAGLDHEVPACA